MEERDDLGSHQEKKKDNGHRIHIQKEKAFPGKREGGANAHESTHRPFQNEWAIP